MNVQFTQRNVLVVGGAVLCAPQMNAILPRARLKTINIPNAGYFSAHFTSFSVKYTKYSPSKYAKWTKKFLVIGHIANFQTCPRGQAIVPFIVSQGGLQNVRKRI